MRCTTVKLLYQRKGTGTAMWSEHPCSKWSISKSEMILFQNIGKKTFYFKLILYVHKYYLSSSIKHCLTECIILSGYLVDVKWKGLHIRNCSKTFKPYLISQKIFMCPYRKMGYMYESSVFINVNWFIYKIIDSLSIQATTIITLCLPLTCSMSIKCWIIEYSCFFSLLR